MATTKSSDTSTQIRHANVLMHTECQRKKNRKMYTLTTKKKEAQRNSNNNNNNKLIQSTELIAIYMYSKKNI